MKKLLLTLILLAAPAPALAADELYQLYAAGKYDEAMRAGAAAGDAHGYAIAARAAMADAVLRPAPCMDCLRRAEAYARQAVAADPHDADGQTWLAVALGYEARITGVVAARLHDAPGQSKAALDAAIKDDPNNAYAVSALGGWHIEVVRGGGSMMARLLYGASESQALVLFDRAVKLAPDNVAIHYQIATLLAGFDARKYRARVEEELQATIHDAPATAYEKSLQSRAGELLSLLRGGDGDRFDALVRKYQGYPE